MTKTNNGFTLIETAVVLVIFGIMASAAFGFVNAQLQQSRINSTKIKQDAIKNALISFISRNSRLPCPAVASLAPGATGYGVEAAPMCTGTILNGTVASGIVPFSSLGLTDDAASDGYYNRFTYMVTLSATNLAPSTVSGMQGSISTHTATPVMNYLPPTGNQINDCTVGNSNPCAAVVALISHGNNGFGAYSESGTQITLPTGADELENANADNKLVMHDYASNGANPFDDIILPLTPSDLLRSLQTIGAVDDPTAAVIKNFLDVETNVITNMVLNKVVVPPNPPNPPCPNPPNTPSGVTNYTVPTIVATGIDPWGQPTKYVRLTNIIIDVCTSPNIAIYKITSGGPDGSIGTADDITKIVYSGQVMTDINKNVW